MTTTSGQSLGGAEGDVGFTAGVPGASEREPPAAAARARRPRHHWVVRVTHWVNFVALGLMVTTGLRIFNAFPAFAKG